MPFNCARPGCRNAVIHHPRTGRRSKYCDDPDCLLARNRERRKKAAHSIACVICGTVVHEADPNQATCENPECKAERKRWNERNRVKRTRGDGVDKGASLAGIDRGTREGFRRYWQARPVGFGIQFGAVTIERAWAQVGGRVA